ncbi:type II secretion system F family protein [Microbacter sp. GSS18]|nr:type II secretion system F family protein [Microbacter sp. GSS18]
MTLVWGAVLGAGLLLAVSPWLWPRRAPGERPVRNRALATMLAEAGLAGAQPNSLLMSAIGAGAVAALAAWLVIGIPVLVVIAAVSAATSPFVWLRARASRLRRTRRTLWPDVCDLLIGSVRAGMSLPDAVAALADSAPDSLRPAFRAFRSDLAASGHFDSAVRMLKQRLADPTADRIIETLRMARQVGGTELTTVLRALSDSVRADAVLRGDVESRQSWTRAAAVLGVSAPWVILILLSLRPEGARAYASPEGIVLVLSGAVVSVVAYRLMLRMGRLPEPRRCFG